jgi:long-chain acyl-CoA synthetase
VIERTSLGKVLESRVKSQKKQSALIFGGKEITYQQLNENVNKLANGLRNLGICKGDRVAIMLPNIPEFVYSFFALQKLGAIAVPFNTMYKGREIIYILNDCGAKAIIALSNFATLINEIKTDVPSLEHVILTGERTLIFVDPESTISIQMVHDSAFFESIDEAYKRVGAILAETFKEFGVMDAWYKHRGSVRVKGRKIASFIISQIENLTVLNALCFIGKLKTDEFFKVIWVPPEIKDKVMEPLTSVEEITGNKLDKIQFKNALVGAFEKGLCINIEEGPLKRDELFAYEKQRSLAHKI